MIILHPFARDLAEERTIMKRWWLIALAMAALAVTASLTVYGNRANWLPEKVAVHWDMDGVADREVDRDALLPELLLLPGLMLGMVGLGFALPWLSPEKFRIEPFQATYNWIMLLIVGIFAYLHAVILAAQTETIASERVLDWIMGGTLLALAGLGSFLGKVRRNFWIGVRTPWTLASEAVWDRTHRLAAWLFGIGGLVGFALLLVGLHPLVALGVFGVFAIAPVFYSLILYKASPQLR